jgi:uncharacterized membrane protein YkvA (DUF1232 family)
MLKRLSVIWTIARGDAKILWHALRHPQAPAWLKLGVGGLVIYLLSPVDLIPEFVPLLGVVDDVVLIPLVVGFLLRKLPTQVRADARKRAGLAPESGGDPVTVDMPR